MDFWGCPEMTKFKKSEKAKTKILKYRGFSRRPDLDFNPLKSPK